jgi:UDP-N-acetylmuramoyl-tripeptide--D-alanyl-D-alanine ligase
MSGRLLFLTQALLVFYYFSSVLQWQSYKLKRVIFNFSKPRWHIVFFGLPIVMIGVVDIFDRPIWEVLFLFVYIIYFTKWLAKLDKKLVFTARVKRLWAIFGVLILLSAFGLPQMFQAAYLLISVAVAYLISAEIEKKIALSFENKALKKLRDISPIVVGITASFGKTSIKNFAAHILAKKHRVYATPASVNTKIGIIKDINEHLPQDAEVYIVEAGARQKGDIAEIVSLVRPQYAVIGKIGEAHIEYFKTIENIQSTKAEMLSSDTLKEAFVFENSGQNGEKLTVFGYENGVQIKNAVSTLGGVSFELFLDEQMHKFEAPNILGAFNAINITAAVLLAKALGMDTESIKRAVESLPSVAHRLQKITAGEKIIIDDSFNGNVDGIKEGIELCRTHPNQKVIVTCGLVESRDELNIELARLIDEVFDVVIVTGELNKKLFDDNIQKCEKIFLRDKKELENILKEKTAPNSIVYFANDAPGYI